MPRQSAGLAGRLVPLVLIGLIAGCSKKVDDARPVATPSIKLSRTDAAVGSPIDVTYKFEVAPDAPAFTEDYTVFVHVLDKDRTSLWGDDHQPRTPTTQWKAGSTVAGASPTGRVESIALSRRIVPDAVSGVANGGLPAVSLTVVVPG